jgi:hypothetical protein
MKARMAAEVLRLTHNIDEKVQSVRVQVKGVDKGVQGVGVRGVDENVNILKEKVQMVIDGAETVLGKSPTPSLLFNRPDGREAATKVKLVMQQIAYNANDVDRRNLRESLRKWQSPPDPSTNTTSHAVSNTRERRSGSVTATSLRNGR